MKKKPSSRHLNLHYYLKFSLSLVIVLTSVACTTQKDLLNRPKDLIAPEVPSAISGLKFSEGEQFMAVTANPYATDVAYEILEKGGSAIDAAIAAQFVLGLVEPQSSGIGGGGLMLSWQDNSRLLRFYDGRETAPASVDDSIFLDSNGETLNFLDAAVSGRSVGVPGLISMLELAHNREGKLPWAELVQPAIKIAQHGFLISERLHTLLSQTNRVNARPEITEYFFSKNNVPWPIGYRLKNLEYADTLKAIALIGSKAFYEGEIANDIVNAVKKDLIPGQLSLDDMSNYIPKIRDAVCNNFFQYEVCVAASPASGITVLQILGILEQFDLNQIDVDSKEMIHLFSEASSLAFADRNTYIADPDFIAEQKEKLLSSDYLNKRAALISWNKTIGKAQPGSTCVECKLGFEDADSPELLSTTQLSIVDSDGNAVSMTSSIENAFGSRIFVRGFLLNNQLTDFSFNSKNLDGTQIANRIEPGKRPRSSMTPSIIFENGQLRLIIGSPGGSRIITYNAQSILYHLVKGFTIEEAIAAPHIVNLNNGLELEEGYFTKQQESELEAIGHEVSYRPQTSGLHGISVTGNLLRGGADPRREGTAKGK